MPAAPDFPPAPDKVAVRRALISVSDKTGLIEAARKLADLGASTPRFHLRPEPTSPVQSRAFGC